MDRQDHPLFREIANNDGNLKPSWAFLEKCKSRGKIDRIVLFRNTRDKEALEILKNAEDDIIGKSNEAYMQKDLPKAQELLKEALSVIESYTGFFEPNTLEYYAQLELVAKCYYLLACVASLSAETKASWQAVVYYSERFLSYYELASDPTYNDRAIHAFYLLSISYMYLENKELSFAAQVKIAEFDPANPDAFLKLARGYYYRGNPAQCRLACENMLALQAEDYKESNEAMLYLIWSVMELGEWQTSIEHLTHAEQEGAPIASYFDVLDSERFAQNQAYTEIKSDFVTKLSKRLISTDKSSWLGDAIKRQQHRILRERGYDPDSLSEEEIVKIIKKA